MKRELHFDRKFWKTQETWLRAQIAQNDKTTTRAMLHGSYDDFCTIVTVLRNTRVELNKGLEIVLAKLDDFDRRDAEFIASHGCTVAEYRRRHQAAEREMERRIKTLSAKGG